MALIKKDKPLDDLKESMSQQMDVFLQVRSYLICHWGLFLLGIILLLGISKCNYSLYIYIFQAETKGFVDSLFVALESKEYLNVNDAVSQADNSEKGKKHLRINVK